MRYRLTIILAAMVVHLAACGGTGVEPPTSDQPETSAASGPTTEPTSSTSAKAPPETTAPPVTTVPTEAPSAQDCQPEPRTTLSSDWTIFYPVGTAYGFGYPSSWGNLSGETRLRASQLLDAATFAETGLADDAEIDLVLVGSGTWALGVFEWSGVASPITEIHRRMVARAQSLTEVQEVFFTDLAACVAGAPGLGMHMLIDAPSNVAADRLYGQELYFVREGTLYSVMMTSTTDVRPEAVDIFEEFLRTWHWP